MEATKKPRIYTYSFGSVYPLYVQKAANKGRTKAEVDEVIRWLTGYSDAQLAVVMRDKIDLEMFFKQAPRLNPKTKLISGVVCGVRLEELTDPMMKKIRYMDKLIDELAKGWPMPKILREDGAAKPKTTKAAPAKKKQAAARAPSSRRKKKNSA